MENFEGIYFNYIQKIKKDFQKIAVSKKYLIIKETNLLIVKKDSDANFREETNFETKKEIINFFPLANNTLFYMEPDEIKKLDLENLAQPPKFKILC